MTSCPARACGSLEGVLQGIPVVGTYLAFFLFGGRSRVTDIIPRMYIIHVLLIPGLFLALISAHLFIMLHQKHTQMPGKGRTERERRRRSRSSRTSWPRAGAWFFFIFAALALAATFAQINPSLALRPVHTAGHLLGLPARLLHGLPRRFTADHARLGVGSFLGHTITFSVFIPLAVPLGIVLDSGRALAVFEQWATGDRREHHVNDRPRNAPIRTALGIAMISFYGVLWLEGI